eukprot:2592248-Rhodomonas_salina.1
MRSTDGGYAATSYGARGGEGAVELRLPVYRARARWYCDTGCSFAMRGSELAYGLREQPTRVLCARRCGGTEGGHVRAELTVLEVWQQASGRSQRPHAR